MLGDLPLRVIDTVGEHVGYVVYVPSTYKRGTPMPALLAIHGGGSNGPEMMSLWREFAEKHGIIVIAPTLSLTLAMEAKVATLYPAIVESARKEWTIDPRRVYVFGYSAGGYSTFAAAMIQPRYFAAAAVFAGMIAPGFDTIVRPPSGPMGIAYYVGDHDQFFKLADTRRTRDLLTTAGFDVHYKELANRDHNIRAASDEFMEDCWAFLSRFAS